MRLPYALKIFLVEKLPGTEDIDLVCPDCADVVEADSEIENEESERSHVRPVSIRPLKRSEKCNIAPPRCSIARLRPSIQPSSRSRCTKASVHSRWAEAVFAPRNPLGGSFASRCACAAIGQAAAAPRRRVMNSRRFID